MCEVINLHSKRGNIALDSLLYQARVGLSRISSQGLMADDVCIKGMPTFTIKVPPRNHPIWEGAIIVDQTDVTTYSNDIFALNDKVANVQWRVNNLDQGEN